MGVGCGVRDSKQIKHSSSSVDEIGEGVCERVVTNGGSCAKSSMSKGGVAADGIMVDNICYSSWCSICVAIR